MYINLFSPNYGYKVDDLNQRGRGKMKCQDRAEDFEYAKWQVSKPSPTSKVLYFYSLLLYRLHPSGRRGTTEERRKKKGERRRKSSTCAV